MERDEGVDIFGGHTEHPLLPLHGDADLGPLMALGVLIALEWVSLFAVELGLLNVPTSVLRPLIGLSVVLRAGGGSSYTS